MKITINNQEIKKALDDVKGGIENNTNHIILSYVLIEIKNQNLLLTTTNSEIEIKTTNKIKENQEATFTLSLIDLNNILSKLDENEDIEFLISDKKIILTTKNNKFELNTLKDYDFHKLINEDEELEEILINKEKLKEAIKKTKFSIAIDSPQKYLNGLFLEISEEKITAASSDGHRLSLIKKESANNINQNKEVIIPKRTIDEFLKLLNETGKEEVSLLINENYIVLNNEYTTISSKLIDGDYPDYKQIFPEDFDNQIIISKKEFEKSLKQVEIFTKENKTIHLSFENNNLKVTTNSEKGSAKSNIETSNFDGNINISFNVAYLIQTLQNLNSENIVFNVDNLDAKVVVINDEDDNDCKYLIMAIKI
jgi:DNA polymerase-3 subunit beta